MPSNLNTTIEPNHSFGFESVKDVSQKVYSPENGFSERLDDESIDAVIGLRNACIVARAALCEALLSGNFDESGATVAVDNINNALARSCFLN